MFQETIAPTRKGIDLSFLLSSDSKIQMDYEILRADDMFPKLASFADTVVITLFDALFYSWTSNLEEILTTNGTVGLKCLDKSNGLYTANTESNKVTIKVDYKDISRQESKPQKRRIITRIGGFYIYTSDGPRGTNQFGDEQSADELKNSFIAYARSSELDVLKSRAKVKIQKELECKKYRTPNLPRQMRRYYKV